MSSGSVKSIIVLLVFILLLGGGGFLVYRHIQQKAEAKKKAVPIEKEYRYGTVKDDSEVLNAEAPQVPDMPVVVARPTTVKPAAATEEDEEEDEEEKTEAEKLEKELQSLSGMSQEERDKA
ncbi:MAG: hypothetical protein IKS92_01865, partial [Victivallales bacterium]|nr:hypothetical protein [Victivallales bacterium]